MLGSRANSEVYSDQCGQGDGIVGERFIKSVLERVSITCGCSRPASGMSSRISALRLGLIGFLSGWSPVSDLIDCSGYVHSPVFRRTQLAHGAARSHFCLNFLHEVHALAYVSTSLFILGEFHIPYDYSATSSRRLWLWLVCKRRCCRS